MMRQGANSAIRFTTYTTLKQFVQSRTRSGQSLPASVTFGMGAIAGLVTVYTTMPLECVGPLVTANRIYACVSSSV
jgi:solute carrier family 25 citrate transporter 1